MLCQCGGWMKGERRGEGTLLRCQKCGDTAALCEKCDAYMEEKVKGTFSCPLCGTKVCS